MNRTEKKCLIGATLGHGFLWLILVVCIAFKGAGDPPPEDLPSVITLIPSVQVTDGQSRGGNRNVTTMPVQQPPQQQVVQQAAPPPPPDPAPAPRAEPTPRVEEPAPKPKVAERAPEPRREEPKPVAKSDIPVKETRKQPEKKFDFADNSKSKKTSDSQERFKFEPTRSNSKTTSRNTSSRSNSSSNSNSRQTESLRELAKAFDNAGNSIGAKAAASTSIEMPGVGDGGILVANYAAFVKAKYDDAWIDPQDVNDETATVKTEIVIQRDGNVVSSRIIRSSGVSALDRSVQKALDRVSYVRPFPEGASDRQRTFILNFNLKARRMAG